MTTFHPHGHPHEDLPGQLRSRGRRLTRQRTLVWAALTSEPDRHLSAGEIAARVRAELPRVNPSTIYRTLELLVDEGLVLRTDLGADRVFYEPAHDHPHHHVVAARAAPSRTSTTTPSATCPSASTRRAASRSATRRSPSSRCARRAGIVAPRPAKERACRSRATRTTILIRTSTATAT